MPSIRRSLSPDSRPDSIGTIIKPQWFRLAAWSLAAGSASILISCSHGIVHKETGTTLSTEGVTAGSCTSLLNLKMAGTTITSATAIAPPFSAPGGATVSTPFCRVVGVSSPSSDSTINFEVWLPEATTWNGKFYSSTGGGSTGAIQYGAMGTGLSAKYAAMSHDRGHISRSDLKTKEGAAIPLSTDGSWAAGHPEKIIDWAHRSQHVTTVASKAIVKAFYSSGPSRSYFVGCSAGGHIGAMEATRYPEDFDGIVAGAPAWNWTNLLVARLWSSQPSMQNSNNALPAAKLKILHTAVVAACDAVDGVKDGLIDDPRKCSFDPSVLQCKGADAADCLTAAQVNTARIISSPSRRPGGEQIFPGYSWGGETLWTVNSGATPGGSAFDFFRYWVQEDANYDARTFNFGSDIDVMNNKLVAGQTLASVVVAKPDIAAYGARGGKLLMWHGWADEQVHALSSIDYYNQVMAANTKAKADGFYRLFMAPGVQHCSGGDGPDSIDTLSTIEKWVEQGVAPDRMTATKFVAGKVTRTRPLCAYPQVAKYSGAGSIDDAANFVCANP